MQRPKLPVQKRTVVGKKVKRLRKDGILPANIYGKDVKSQAVQVPLKTFETLYKQAGETGLVDIEVDGQLLPVLIHNVQTDHITYEPLHADFYQVNLKEKVKTMVPLEVVGEPKAVSEKIGIVLQPLSEVEVEALPADLPEKIEVDVQHLASIDEQITVGDLKKPNGVEILTDAGQVIVKIAALVTKEAEAEAQAQAAEAEAAKAGSVEGAESETPEAAKAEDGGAQKKDEGGNVDKPKEATQPEKKPQA